MRPRALVCALALVGAGVVPVVGTASHAEAAPWSARPASYGVAKVTDVPIRMSDGVVLKADVVHPAAADGSVAPGQFPVVLTQTPYNKQNPQLDFENDFLVQRGYVQVIVDVRGTGASQGQWASFADREQRDYLETAEWAVHQPFSDGRLATYGISYGAIAQVYTGAQHPTGLRAMFPIVPLGDAYRDVTVSGGQVDSGFIPFWLGLVTGAGFEPSPAWGKDPQGSLQAQADHVRGITEFQLPAVASAMTGQPIGDKDGAFDGPFYRTRSPLEVIDQVDVPTFVVGGLYDLFQRGEPMLYNRLRANGVPTRLLLGPWTHLEASSGAGLPAPGVPSLDELALRWFDHYVRDVDDPGLDTDIAPVTYYEIGTGGYRTSTAYPPAGTAYSELPLGGAPVPGSPGTLGGTPTDGTGTVPFLPVAGACSESSSQWTAGVVPNGQPLCSGDHRVNDLTGIAYDLPVTGSALRIGGTSMARLFVSTNRADAAVTARLEDVAPDGTVVPLTSGWQVLSLRAVDQAKSEVRDGLLVQPWHPDTRASVLPVEPGAVYELDVEVFPTTASIAPGHVLRLAVQSSDSPHSSAPAPQAADEAGGVLSVVSDGVHRSSLVLGVQP